MKSTKLPDEFFDFHNDFLLPSPTNIFIFQIIWNSLKDIPGERLLDAGCGSGTVLSLIGMKRKFLLLHGIDLSEYAINLANKNFFKQKINAQAFISDISGFECMEKYDIIISTEVIEHVNDPDEMINGMSRCLNKKGHILLTTPLEDNRDNVKWDKSFHHLRRFTILELFELFKRNGFNIQLISGIGFPFFYLFIKLKHFIHRNEDLIEPILTGRKRYLFYFVAPFLNILFYIDYILSKISFFRERGNTVYLIAEKID